MERLSVGSLPHVRLSHTGGHPEVGRRCQADNSCCWQPPAVPLIFGAAVLAGLAGSAAVLEGMEVPARASHHASPLCGLGGCDPSWHARDWQCPGDVQHVPPSYTMFCYVGVTQRVSHQKDGTDQGQMCVHPQMLRPCKTKGSSFSIISLEINL